MSMKKVAGLLSMLFVAGIAAVPAFAQAAAEPGKPPEHVARRIVLAAGFSMAIAAAACGIAQRRVAAAGCGGLGGDTGAAGAIRTAMILGLVFIETLVLF